MYNVKSNKAEEFIDDQEILETIAYAKENKDKSFKYMWLTIVLSFGFYIPVVLWADVYPIIGMLMIPKTCAYVWTIWIGYSDMKGRVRS